MIAQKSSSSNNIILPYSKPLVKAKNKLAIESVFHHFLLFYIHAEFFKNHFLLKARGLFTLKK